MLNYQDIIKNRELRLKLINLLRFIPDKPYLKMVYKIKTGKKLNLKNPQTFSEKIQWLKLNEKHDEYTDLVDKIKVRKAVEKIMGEDICFPLIGVWDRYEDIDFDSLPDKFVLKCNHDSGSVKLIKDKSKMDHKMLAEFFNGRLKINAYVLGREYPYKNVPPKIIAEKYMESQTSGEIRDYKFFCFDGQAKLMYVALDRSINPRFDFFDMSFNRLDITNCDCPPSNKIYAKPEKFDEMKAIAEKLSRGMKQVRIDLYEIDNKIYFGEYTFFHAGGFWPFEPEEWEKKIGDMIKL